MMRAILSHHCDLGLIPRPGVTCRLSLLLVLILARGVFLWDPWFFSLHKKKQNKYAKFPVRPDAHMPSKQVIELFGITWVNKLLFTLPRTQVLLFFFVEALRDEAQRIMGRLNWRCDALHYISRSCHEETAKWHQGTRQLLTIILREAKATSYQIYLLNISLIIIIIIIKPTSLKSFS